MEKRFLLFKTVMKRFKGIEQYSLITSKNKELIAVVDPEGLTITEIKNQLGEFQVYMHLSQGMDHFKKGEGDFFK